MATKDPFAALKKLEEWEPSVKPTEEVTPTLPTFDDAAINRMKAEMAEMRNKDKGIVGRYFDKVKSYMDSPVESAEIEQALGEEAQALPDVEGTRVGQYVPAFKTAYKVANYGMERGRIGARIHAGTATDADLVRLEQLNQLTQAVMSQASKDPFEAKAFGTIAPYLINSATQGGKGALIGAMIAGGAAAAAGFAGPQAGVPEEVVTVPGAAWLGAKVGGAFFSVSDIAEIEKGSAYLDMMELGIDEGVAKTAANVYALGSAGLELAQFKMLKYVLPDGDKLARNAIAKAIRQTLKNNAAAKFGGRAGTVALGEAGVETTQEFVGNVTKLASSYISDSLEGTNVRPETVGIFIDRLTQGLAETFATTAVGFGIAAVPGAAVSTMMPAYEAPTLVAPELERTGFREVRVPEADIPPEMAPAHIPKKKPAPIKKVPTTPEEVVEEKELTTEEIIPEEKPVKPPKKKKEKPEPEPKKPEEPIKDLDAWMHQRDKERDEQIATIAAPEPTAPVQDQTASEWLESISKERTEPVSTEIAPVEEALPEDDPRAIITRMANQYGADATALIEKQNLKFSDLKQPSAKLKDGTVVKGKTIEKTIAPSKPEAHEDLNEAWEDLKARYGDDISQIGFTVDGTFIPNEIAVEMLGNKIEKLETQAMRATDRKAYDAMMQRYNRAIKAEQKFQEDIANMREPTQDDAKLMSKIMNRVRAVARSYGREGLGSRIDPVDLEGFAFEKAWQWIRSKSEADIKATLAGDKETAGKVLGILLSRKNGYLLQLLRNFGKDEEGKRQGKSRRTINDEIQKGIFQYNASFADDVSLETIAAAERLMEREAKKPLEETPLPVREIPAEAYVEPEAYAPPIPEGRLPEDAIDVAQAARDRQMGEDMAAEVTRAGIVIDQARRRGLSDADITQRLQGLGYDEAFLAEAFRLADKVAVGREATAREKATAEERAIAEAEERRARREKQKPKRPKVEVPKERKRTTVLGGRKVPTYRGMAFAESDVGQKLIPVTKEGTYWDRLADGKSEENAIIAAARAAGGPLVRVGDDYFITNITDRAQSKAKTEAALTKAQRRLMAKREAAAKAKAEARKEKAKLRHQLEIIKLRRQIANIRMALEEIKKPTTKTEVTAEELKAMKPVRAPRRKIVDVEKRKREMTAEERRKAAERRVKEKAEREARREARRAKREAKQPTIAGTETKLNEAYWALQAKTPYDQIHLASIKFAAGVSQEALTNWVRKHAALGTGIAGKGKPEKATTHQKEAAVRIGAEKYLTIKLVERPKAAPAPKPTPKPVAKKKPMVTMATLKEQVVKERVAPKATQVIDKQYLANFLKNEKGETEVIGKLAAVLHKQVTGAGKKVLDWLQVEPKFKRLGAANTGTAVKNVQSRIAAEQEHGSRIVNQIHNALVKSFGKEKIDRDTLGQVVVAAESKRYMSLLSKDLQEKIKPAVEIIRQYFEDSQLELRNRGISVDFTKRMIEKLQNFLKEEHTLEEGLRWRRQIRQLKRMQFIHIPVQLWTLGNVNKMARQDVDFSGKIAVLQNLIAKERHAISLRELVDKKAIKLSKINPYEIIMAYATAKGHDFAMADIRDAAKDEGLIKTTDTKPKKHKALEDFASWSPVTDRKKALKVEGAAHTWISDLLLDAIDNSLASLQGQTRWQKALALVKMSQFYNPFFLPMYDMFQHMMASPVKVWHLPKAWSGAIKDVYTKSDNYIEALSYGLASKPFSMPFQEMVTRAEYLRGKGQHGTMLNLGLMLLKQSTKLSEGSLLKPLYQLSWTMAWKMDETIRMATYNYMRKRGVPPNQAAQVAATFHGDYASVPAKTRRILNSFLFTPTFKIAMARLHVNMLKNFITTFGGIRGIPADRRYALGLLATVGLNMAMHAVMTTTLGLEEDDWGRRYKKDIYTRLGPKEFVMTYSTPANISLKYFYKIAKVGKLLREGTENIPGDLFNLFKWDLHPMYLTAMNLLANKTSAGEEIVPEFSKGWQKPAYMLYYAAKELVGIFGFAMERAHDDAAKQKIARQRLYRDYDKLGVVLDNLAFSYIRETKRMRTATRLKAKVRRFRKAQKKSAIEKGGFNKEWLKEYRRQLKELTKEFK